MTFFITGTDTDVGKTVVAAWLALHLHASYWKPIQTGMLQGRDSEVVAHLGQVPTFPESYCLEAPLAPLVAAQREGRTIEPALIQKPHAEKLIIEGAGGLFVPITAHFLMIDLIQEMGAPLLVVARTTLGTINHTCLTLEALKRRALPIVGIILNGPKNRENREMIECLGKVPVLEELEPFGTLSYNALQARIPSARLMEALHVS